MHRFLPLFALLSGVSGIAYELLYFKLIGSYIGNVFYVGAAVLAIFFSGIALGAITAKDRYRWLALAELGLGLYAVSISYLFATASFSISALVYQFPFTSTVNIVLLVGMVLAIPAFLIGLTTPWFTAYVNQYRTAGDGFGIVYWSYNLGAAGSVLFVEYVLIRTFGISSSLLFLASVNACIALFISLLPTPKKDPDTSYVTQPQSLPRIDTALLWTVSILSGIAQLALINQLSHVIGPLLENFALLMAVMLLSLSVGTYLVYKCNYSFRIWLVTGPMVCVLPIVFYKEFIAFFAAIGSEHYLFAKILFATLCMLPIAGFFAVSVPAIVRTHGKQFIGGALAVASAGNVLGFLSYIFILHAHFANYVILTGVVLGLLGCTIVGSRLGEKKLRLAVVLVTIFLLPVALLRWPTELEYVSFHDIISVVSLGGYNDALSTSVEFRQYGDDVVITQGLGSNYYRLQFNGHYSLVLGQNLPSHRNELLVGAVGSHFSSGHDRALILGLGSGISAAGAADRYELVEVFEINPVMLRTAEFFAELNDLVLEKPNVKVHIQDGVLALVDTDESYDVIVNTVTTPSYFSANKLWTADFFKLVKTKLADGGVFIGWLDNRLGDTGASVLVDTLHTVFPDCQYLAIVPDYIVFVCGEKLQPSGFHGENTLFARQVSSVLPTVSEEELLSALTLSFRGPVEVDRENINTIDRPLLAYTYASYDTRDTFSRGALAKSLAEISLSDDFEDVVYPWWTSVIGGK